MFKKNFVRKFVEKIYKMGFLEGSGVPVLYIGRKVRKGFVEEHDKSNDLYSCVKVLSCVSKCE
jgi:hypothetical protein